MESKRPYHLSKIPERFKRPLGWSLAIHGVILLIAIFGLPHWRKPPMILTTPVMVNVITPSEFTTATNTRKHQKIVSQKPAEAKQTESKKTPKTEPKKLENPSPDIQPDPKPVDKAPDKTAKPEAKAPLKKKETKPKKPEKTKEPEKKPDPKKTAQAQDDFNSVLKNLVGDEKPTPKKSDAPVKDDTPPSPEASAIPAPIVDANKPEGMAPMIGEGITISEIDLLRQQLAGCWSVPVGAANAENLIVDVDVTIAPDRRVLTADIVDRSRYSTDAFFRTAAESARRALLSPDCSPLNLPDSKYQIWRTMRIRFNPREMFGY